MSGATIGNWVNIGDHAFIEGGAVIGDRVTIKNGVCIWDGITIADDCFIGPGVMFTNDTYPRSPRMEIVADRYADRLQWLSETKVRRGCSIGARAVICPGVDLGTFGMIAAGSVVTGDTQAFALMVGSPAKHVADVCSCGRPLSGRFDRSDCKHCGETAAERVQQGFK